MLLTIVHITAGVLGVLVEHLKYPHTASAAEVFFGARRSINLGVEIGL